MNGRPRWQFVSLLALATLVLRAPGLGRMLMDPDEGSYMAIACRMLRGGLPYRDGVENKFPAIFYTYDAIYRVFGRYNTVAVHLVVALVALLTALACGAIARRLVRDPRAGDWAAAMYVVLSTVYYPKILAGNTEMFLVLPASLAVLAYLAARERPALLVVAGALAGVTLLYKQVAGAVLGALLLDAAWRGVTEKRIGRAIRDEFLVGAGFAVVIAGAVAGLRRAGVLDDAVFWTWTYVLKHYLPAGTRDHGILFNLATSLLPYLAAISPAVACAVWKARTRDATTGWFWLAAMAAATMVGGRMYGHYFLMMLPPWCVLGGIGAARLLDEKPAWKKLLVGSLGALGVGFLCFAAIYEPNTTTLFRPEPNYHEAAAWVRAHTRDGDDIFVWGWFPNLYVESDRCPSTRFVYTHILTGRLATGKAHDVPEGWQMLMHDLEAAPPPYILDTSPGDYTSFGKYPLEAYPLLWDFVRRRYVLETEVAGVKMYRRR